jgi:hypothetical protein
MVEAILQGQNQFDWGGANPIPCGAIVPPPPPASYKVKKAMVWKGHYMLCVRIVETSPGYLEIYGHCLSTWKR